MKYIFEEMLIFVEKSGNLPCRGFLKINHFGYIIFTQRQFYDCILKANLSWSPTSSKSCQLIASLSVVLPQVNMTKIKLEYLKTGF